MTGTRASLACIVARRLDDWPARVSGDWIVGIGHGVATTDEADTILRLAEAAGATRTAITHDRPWGIYSGYLKDPDGHLWEVMWNPGPDLG